MRKLRRSATRTCCCARSRARPGRLRRGAAASSSEQRPEYVFLAAAKVGGILANRDFPADFIARNLRIQSNVIECAYRAGSSGCSSSAQAASIPSWRRSRYAKINC